MNFICRVCCHAEKLRVFTAREMMFGTREPFLYDQCSKCKSLQISELPDQSILARHYPSDYYAYGSSFEFPTMKGHPFRTWLAIRRDLYALGIGNFIGRVVNHFQPAQLELTSLASLKIPITARILDVGCGTKATLLNRMFRMGFRNVLGVDPFISSDTVSLSGVKVLKRQLEEIEGKFDLIMFHHSFEHVPEPRKVLAQVRRLLRPGGKCAIRIPTPSSDAFDLYHENWVQFDPPRHLVLISREGMKLIAHDCGFALENVVDDSTRFQFTGSELYLKDVPLVEQKERAEFSEKKLREFDLRAMQLNSVHRGDAAAFFLKKLDEKHSPAPAI